jgi:hypothetical protein
VETSESSKARGSSYGFEFEVGRPKEQPCTWIGDVDWATCGVKLHYYYWGDCTVFEKYDAKGNFCGSYSECPEAEPEKSSEPPKPEEKKEESN